MLNEDPERRWNVQQVADCAWLNKYEEPDYIKIYFAIDKVIEYLHK
jgi:hypothetical protein